jgi:uncharacterized protein (TIGR03000 family)
MFTVVLLTALTAGENVAEFHPRGGCYGGGCYGCSGGCYGGYGSCYGCGGGYTVPYYGGCYGSAWRGHNCFGCGGCYGCYGGYAWGHLNGVKNYGTCYGACYGMGYSCTGGCWGASYGCYGAGCHGGCYGGCAGGDMSGYGCGGGCGGYMSAGYGVPQAGVGVPVNPTDGTKVDGKAGAELGNRARLVFTLPEGAKLFIDGVPVEISATQNAFRTPELKPGAKYFYEARVEIEKDGKVLRGTRRIYVSAGQTVEEDLTTVELKPDVEVFTKP